MGDGVGEGLAIERGDGVAKGGNERPGGGRRKDSKMTLKSTSRDTIIRGAAGTKGDLCATSTLWSASAPNFIPRRGDRCLRLPGLSSRPQLLQTDAFSGLGKVQNGHAGIVVLLLLLCSG